MSDINFDECPCSGKSMSMLVAPWILITLYHHGGAHGYDIQKMILKKLQELDLGLNVTGLYRHLNMMEKRGLLRSTWDTGTPGPAKRRYFLTEDGKECLRRWSGVLSTQMMLIEKFLDEAGRILPLSAVHGAIPKQPVTEK